MKTQFDAYTLSSTYQPKCLPSPLNPKIKKGYTIQVSNAHNLGKSCDILIWREDDQDKITSERLLLLTFHEVLNASLYGSFDPAQFCECLGLNPHAAESEAMFHSCRLITENIYPLIYPANPSDIMKRIEQALNKDITR